MVLETWILPLTGASGALSQFAVLRLLRLLRITRMAKLMRFVPELQIIVKGMVAAVRSVLCTLLLGSLVLYVWAILFTSEFHQGVQTEEEVAGTAKELFGTMGKSLRHLFIMGTILDDITLCCNSIRSSEKPHTMLAAFILFVLISSFTMLNMLIGILCEVVCATGEGERNKNTEAHVREAITNLFRRMDKDNNGEITRDEFLSMKRDKDVMSALQELDVKGKHFEMYADLMFKLEDDSDEYPTIDFEKTMDIILRLRPNSKVTALDFASFQMTVGKNQARLNKHLANVENMTSLLTASELGAQASQVAQKPAINNADIRPLPRLENSSDQEILAELQKRLGITSGSKAHAFESKASDMLEIERTLKPSKIVDDYQTQMPELPGLPDITSWSKETYTC
jgi:hypothetical protein